MCTTELHGRGLVCVATEGAFDKLQAVILMQTGADPPARQLVLSRFLNDKLPKSRKNRRYLDIFIIKLSKSNLIYWFE